MSCSSWAERNLKFYAKAYSVLKYWLFKIQNATENTSSNICAGKEALCINLIRSVVFFGQKWKNIKTRAKLKVNLAKSLITIRVKILLHDAIDLLRNQWSEWYFRIFGFKKQNLDEIYRIKTPLVKNSSIYHSKRTNVKFKHFTRHRMISKGFLKGLNFEWNYSQLKFKYTFKKNESTFGPSAKIVFYIP